MAQKVLPFKLETTNDVITPHAGLAVFGEFIHATDVINQINRELPAPGSNRGYLPSLFVVPLLLMLHGGDRDLEFIQYCCKQMSKRNHITALRADSATYQADIFNWCEGNSIQFAIGGQLDSAIYAGDYIKQPGK